FVSNFRRHSDQIKFGDVFPTVFRTKYIRYDPSEIRREARLFSDGFPITIL
ncbi:unnamed protein product, partial [Arabidopsis halleri]